MTYAVATCLPAHPRFYRYWLEITLADSGPRLAAILKNPSTATATRSDPTVGKVSAWARRSGFGALIVVNLFAYRAMHPAALNALPYARAVGSENDHYLREAARQADVLVVAWGNPNGIRPERYATRIREVAALLGSVPWQQVGRPTAAGHPRHGLWWDQTMRLAPFDI